MDKLVKVGAITGVLTILGFELLLGLAMQAADLLQGGNSTGCTTPAPTAPVSTPASMEHPCLAPSRYGAQVVMWAERMANALTVDPGCGSRRTAPDCNSYRWYTAAFPQEVVQYGQNWCQVHGGCEVWANGNYQCVSFVRGAYSQVYPMNLTGNAFDLWALYQHQAGWREIPAAAVGDVTARGLPQPGDVMVFKDRGVGHVAIVISVTAPQQGVNGEVTFANANSTSPYDHMSLLPSLLVDTSTWTNNTYFVWGYLRPATNAASALTRIGQLDPAQYASTNEFDTWAYSACSAAAMTEVLNAYGFQLRIQDVLDIERSLTIPGSQPPEPYITPQLGLTAEAGIAATMEHFGLTTTWGDHYTLDQVEQIANSGTPVIVSWPPARYLGGHIVVVVGGDHSLVRIADSSSWDRSVVSTARFLQWWGGFAAIATPRGTSVALPSATASVADQTHAPDLQV